MYTKGQLNRFADQISDAEQQQIFRDRIAEIAFRDERGIEICNAPELDDALSGSGVEHLAKELGSRIEEFISEDDFPKS